MTTRGRKGGARARMAGRKRAKKWSARAERTFLEALAASANVEGAAETAGMSRSQCYYRRDHRPEFRDAWDDALSQGYARLEANMLRRALEGVARPVIRSGKTVATVIEYSDAINLRLLTRHEALVERRTARRSAIERDSVAEREALKAEVKEIRRRLLGLPDDDEDEDGAGDGIGAGDGRPDGDGGGDGGGGAD